MGGNDWEDFLKVLMKQRTEKITYVMFCFFETGFHSIVQAGLGLMARL